MPNQRIPDSLIEDMRETLRREAFNAKQAALAHSMKTRALQKSTTYELGSARANEQAQKLHDLVANAREEWKRGYNNDWMSSTYSMLIMIEQITAYLEACNLRGMAVDAVDRFLGMGVGYVVGMKDDEIASLSEYFNRGLDEYTYKNPPEKALPKLQYHVNVVDGKLNFDSLKDMTRSDGKPMFPTLNNPNLEADEDAQAQVAINALRKRLEMQLEAGLTLWLEQHGYVHAEAAGPQNAQGDTVYTTSNDFVNRDNPAEKLTEAKFKELRISAAFPEHSLDAFLKGEFQMDFQHSAAPRH